MQTAFAKPGDWVFASPFQGGRMPYRPWGVQQRRIKPAARKAKLGDVGWHTFRHYAEFRNMPNDRAMAAA